MFEIDSMPASIEIGFTGEQNFRPVQIDMTKWMRKMPDGVPSIVHIRPGESNEDAYIVATTFEDNILTWAVSASDLGVVEGIGSAQVWLEEEENDTLDKRGMSTLFATIIRQSIGDIESTVPPAQMPWMQQMTLLKTETVGAKLGAEEAEADAVTAKEAAEYAQNKAEAAQSAAETARDAAQAAAGNFQDMSATVTGLDEGEDPTIEVTHSQGGYYNLAFGIPKGDKGDKGDQGDPPTDAQVQTAANAYLATVITNPDSPPLDRSLSSNVSAAPADMVGDLKSAINDIEDIVYYDSEIDLSSQSTIAYSISPSTGKWATATTYEGYMLSVPSGAEYLKITPNATNGTVYAMLKTSDHASGTTPNYATGETRTFITENTTVKIPSDCAYVYISKKLGVSGTDYNPSYVAFGVKKNIPNVDNTLSISGDAADAKVTGDKIKKITDEITETEVVDIASASVRKGLITISNLWSLTNGFDSYPFAIGKGEYYELSVTASAEHLASVGLLKNSNLVSGETPPFCDGITERIVIQAGETENIKIPSDCAYIVIMKTGANSVDYTPASIVFKKWVMSSLQVIPLGLHEMPSSESALNIVKRCRQMSDIKWTPAVDLPRCMLVQRKGEIPESASSQNYLGTFKAGVEYTGIPYGRVSQTMENYGYNYGTVGRYIDFKTFITSIMNPMSRLSKENVGSVSGHRSVIYATVCSGMTCYALNVPEVPTTNIGNISGLVLVGKLNNNGVLLSDSSIKIGDVLNLPSIHTAIITDIVRDTDGVIQAVELTDASTAGLADRNYDDGLIGGLCRRKGWIREQFFAEGSWGDYYVYRYTKNVSYTPSPYVNVGDEFNFQRIEHFPVMPYEGEGFVFKTGYIPNNAVKLVIHLSGYGFLRVFKDGNEISGSPFAVESGTEEISIPTIDAGNYTAYLCNMDNGQVINLTAECSWAITE